MVGVGGLGVVVVGRVTSVLRFSLLRQRLLSLQRRDGWLVSVLVSAAVSAIPIPNRYHWYQPDTDTEYWYRSKPNYRSCWIVFNHVAAWERPGGHLQFSKSKAVKIYLDEPSDSYKILSKLHSTPSIPWDISTTEWPIWGLASMGRHGCW